MFVFVLMIVFDLRHDSGGHGRRDRILRSWESSTMEDSWLKKCVLFRSRVLADR
jgi:hypothetical protein